MVIVLSGMKRWNQCNTAGSVGRRDERIEVAPAVAGLDQVHAVPGERLLDQQLGAQLFVERARGLVAGDDPDDEPGGAMRALRGGDGGDQPLADPGALRFAHEVDRRQLGVEAVLRLGQHVARREADDAARRFSATNMLVVFGPRSAPSSHSAVLSSTVMAAR